MLAAVGDEVLLRGGVDVRVEHDERRDELAPLLVGDADHRDLAHRVVRHQGVLDLDRGDVLAAGDDDVLLAVGDRDVAVLERAAVAGVEPVAPLRLLGGLGVLPVRGEVVVRLREHLAGVVDHDPHAHRRRSGTAQEPGLLGGLEVVPLRAHARHREQR